jgi:hypothetical protein
MEKNKIPDRVSCEKADKLLYDRLTEQKESPFYKRDLLDVFACAVALGYHYKSRKNLKTKEGLILRSVIEKNDEAMWLLRAVAISARGPDVIIDMKEILKIVEEYANGGIKRLYDIVFKSEAGTPIKHLESMALETLKSEK